MIPLPFINYYLRQNKLINMFHVLKWADISLNNPLKNKKKMINWLSRKIS
jgi:hypothetical protein